MGLFTVVTHIPPMPHISLGKTLPRIDGSRE